MTRSTYTLLRPAEGDREALTDDDGEAEAEGLRDLEELGEPEEEGEADLDGEPLGLVEGLALELGESDRL